MGRLHFTYQTKNLVNNNTYIGIHSTDNLDDRYLGSGEALARAINKYGRENFVCTPLDFFDTREEAFEEERFLVHKEWIDRESNYNLSLGGNGGSLSWDEQKKIYHRENGSYKKSDDTKRKLSKISKLREDKSRLFKKGSDNIIHRVQFTLEKRRQMSISSELSWTKERKERFTKNNSGENNVHFGKRKTESHKQKISQALRKLSIENQREVILEYSNQRGQKTSLAKKYSVSIDVITNLVGKSFTHNKCKLVKP